MPRNILLTGGCGYLGSNFVKYWTGAHPEDSIIILDALTYAGRFSNVFTGAYRLDTFDHKGWTWDKYTSPELPNVVVIPGRMEDYNLLNTIASCFSIDLCVSMAAESHVDNSLKNALPFIKTNVEGTFQVLSICKEKNIPLIHISTDEVLKHFAPNYCDHGEPDFSLSRVAEDGVLAPKNPYSGSKAAAEMLCQSYRENFGLPITIVRPTNLIGPSNQANEKFLPKALTNLLNGKKVPLYGEGKEARDWLYVQDACKALDIIINLTKREDIYHIAPNNETSNREILKKVLDRLGISWEDGVELVENRLGHDPWYALDSSKIRSLGWAPTPLEEVLDLTVNYYKDKLSER